MTFLLILVLLNYYYIKVSFHHSFFLRGCRKEKIEVPTIKKEAE